MRMGQSCFHATGITGFEETLTSRFRHEQFVNYACYGLAVCDVQALRLRRCGLLFADSSVSCGGYKLMVPFWYFFAIGE